MTGIRWRSTERKDDNQDSKPSLESVLEHYDVRLRSHRNQMVSCPLHEDRTPSLSVDLDHDLWRCHSCGKGGDSYQLIMEKEGLNFVRARAFASSLGLAEGSSGGGDSELSGSPWSQRRGGRSGSSSEGSRSGSGGSAYRPAWRRR